MHTNPWISFSCATEKDLTLSVNHLVDFRQRFRRDCLPSKGEYIEILNKLSSMISSCDIKYCIFSVLSYKWQAS